MRPTPFVPGRLLHACAALALTAVAACSPPFEKLERKASARGSLGVEVYKLLCRRVAGTELPSDLDGRSSEPLCLGDGPAVEAELRARGTSLPAPLRALAAQRSDVVNAVDGLAPPPLPHALDPVFRSLVPYYGDPEPRVPLATRAFAAWLDGLTSDDAALSALARLLRDGMVAPVDGDGLLRAASASPALSAQLATLVPALLDGPLAAPFEALRTGLALDLAAAPTPAPEDDDGLARLLAHRDTDTPSSFGAGAPLWSALRDARGLPLPLGPGVPFPFVDRDGDGQADAADDQLLADARLGAPLPEPFAVLHEAGVARTGDGRACALSDAGAPDCTRTLYAYTDDRTGTLLSALVPELRRALTGDQSLGAALLALLPALLGDPQPMSARFGVASHAFSAAGGPDDPLLGLVQAFSAAEASAAYDHSLYTAQLALDGLRAQLAPALAPWLRLLSRTGPDADAYPGARLASPNTFWDELLWEGERLARRRLTRGGESAVAGLLWAALGYTGPDGALGGAARPVGVARLAHAGGLLALMLRYKDDWHSNPRAAAERVSGEPVVVGGFRVPVDRSAPDLPVSCGADGCGGPVAGTPFAAIALKGQRCMIEHDAQRGRGDDCGAAGNQSIFQRSVGLIWESYGRSQCNRPLSIADLVDEALGDPCTSLDPAVPCSVDTDCAAVTPRSADYACDGLHGLCVARAGSALCDTLQRKATEDRAALVFVAEQAVALDYVCPEDDPAAACHAFADRYPAAFIDTDGDGPLGATLQACHLIDMKDVGRVFGRALDAAYTLDIPNPWVHRFLEDVARAGPVSASDDAPRVPDCGLDFRIVDPREVPSCIPVAARATRALYEEIPADVDTLGELVEFLLGDDALFGSDDDTAALRPDARVLTRVLFAAGPAEGVQLFDPLLMRAAPPSCQTAPTLPACAVSGDPAARCCIADTVVPPLQYRLDTYFGSTTFALEHGVRFRDGTELSFFDVARPLAAVFNRLDADPAGAGPLPDVEDTDYGLIRIGRMVAEHYDSADNAAAQSALPGGRWYRRKTGLVRYEELLADVFDDGAVDASQPGLGARALVDGADLVARDHGAAYAGLIGFIEALAAAPDAHTNGPATRGHSALDGLGRATELFLNPHLFCAGDAGDDRVLAGRGACDAIAPTRAPLRDRTGVAAPCWNDGACFDGTSPDRPRRYLSPLLLMRGAAARLMERAARTPSTDAALHDVLTRAAELWLASDAQGFSQPRAVAVARALLGHARDGWARARAEGRLEGKADADLSELAETLRSPGTAALLQLLTAIDGALREALLGLLTAALAPELERPLVASVSDVLVRRNAEKVLQPANAALARLLVPNLAAYLEGRDPSPAPGGALRAELSVLAPLVAADPDQALARLALNLTTPGAAGASPLALLSDVTLAVHRRASGLRAPAAGADLRQLSRHVADFLRDDRRGVERLVDIVRCATADPKPARCAAGD